MNPEHLAVMVNDIANFFAAESDRAVAVDGVYNHLRKFWEPRMRRQIVAYLHETGGGELSELARAGVEKLGASEPAARTA